MGGADSGVPGPRRGSAQVSDPGPGPAAPATPDTGGWRVQGQPVSAAAGLRRVPLSGRRPPQGPRRAQGRQQKGAARPCGDLPVARRTSAGGAGPGRAPATLPPSLPPCLTGMRPFSACPHKAPSPRRPRPARCRRPVGTPGLFPPPRRAGQGSGAGAGARGGGSASVPARSQRPSPPDARPREGERAAPWACSWAPGLRLRPARLGPAGDGFAFRRRRGPASAPTAVAAP